MSSPVNEDHSDKRTMYAPPWARETTKQPPETIIAEVERLRLERQRAAAAVDVAVRAQPAGDDRDQNELSPGAADDIEAALADAIRASKWTPRSLEPVAMREPRPPRPDGPSWGMVVRLGGAVTAAAIVALFLSGAVRLSSIDVALGTRDSTKGGSAIAQALGAGEAQPQRQPFVVADASSSLPLPIETAVTPSPSPIAAPPTAASSALPQNVLTAYASLDTQPPAISLKAKSDDAQAIVTSKLGEVRVLGRDELAGLVKRGQVLLSEGDIASARLLLRRAAEAGEAHAALLLAGTYDRVELAKLKVIGVAADHAQAKAWYTKAVEHGSAEALRRLQQLAQRAE